MKKKITLILFTLVCLATFSACGTKKISGEYTTTVNLLFGETTNTLAFTGGVSIKS